MNSHIEKFISKEKGSAGTLPSKVAKKSAFPTRLRAHLCICRMLKMHL